MIFEYIKARSSAFIFQFTEEVAMFCNIGLVYLWSSYYTVVTNKKKMVIWSRCLSLIGYLLSLSNIQTAFPDSFTISILAISLHIFCALYIPPTFLFSSS